LAKKKITEL